MRQYIAGVAPAHWGEQELRTQITSIINTMCQYLHGGGCTYDLVFWRALEEEDAADRARVSQAHIEVIAPLLAEE